MEGGLVSEIFCIMHVSFPLNQRIKVQAPTNLLTDINRTQTEKTHQLSKKNI